ncbi:MAG: UDP-N-acetylmuramoyl-L-alanine--D-glutamate ligase [bacterium]|nr:UDP-N-acetylmuramoyl-L-alanine--D-glutamate ligase [bacterium]
MKKDDIKKALVVGLGFRTGLAAANFLAKKGVSVVVSDMKKEEELAGIIEQLNKSVRVIPGSQEPGILDEGFDVLVLSPGVPKAIPLVQAAYTKGIPVISEVELSYLYLKGRVISISGTDGKSTTTCLTGHILKALGYGTFVGGNIGIPLISLVEETREDSISVVELSSFQLETIDTYNSEVAAILNVTPDHLDRYTGMDDYLEAKLNIVKNQGADDFYVYNLDDATLTGCARRAASGHRTFSLVNTSADSYYDTGLVYIREEGQARAILEEDRMRIMGLHNIQNAMAAILMVSSLQKKMGHEVDYDAIVEACYTFTGLPHRMERVGEIEGRLVINDSKATTIGALEMAVKSIKGTGVLILGGRTKGDDYTRLIEILKGIISTVVVIGESKEYFSKILEEYDPVPAADLDDALVQAMKNSSSGDTILLSPACASFDMFKSYEERGDLFKESCEKMLSGSLHWT